MSVRSVRPLGVVLALLGVALVVQSIATATATSWVVDPLRYRRVEFHQGFRSSPVIHLTGKDGETYVLHEQLWRDSWDGRELAARLREADRAVVRVAGGEPRWLYGYPRVRTLESGSVVLRAPPTGPGKVWTRRLLGPLLGVVGVMVFWKGGRAA